MFYNYMDERMLIKLQHGQLGWHIRNIYFVEQCVAERKQQRYMVYIYRSITVGE